MKLKRLLVVAALAIFALLALAFGLQTANDAACALDRCPRSGRPTGLWLYYFLLISWAILVIHLSIALVSRSKWIFLFFAFISTVVLGGAFFSFDAKAWFLFSYVASVGIGNLTLALAIRQRTARSQQ